MTMTLPGWRRNVFLVFFTGIAASTPVLTDDVLKSNEQTSSNSVVSSSLSSNETGIGSEMTSSATKSPDDDVFLPWDNPYNVIPQRTYLTVKKVMFCYVSLGLLLIGVPCNVLNCAVFCRQGLKERMNLCLFCLACVDLMVVIIVYLISSHCLVGMFDLDFQQWWNSLFRKYFTGFFRGFQYSSGCLTALISLERCVCVVLPLKAASLIRTRTMAVLIAVILGLIQLAAVLYPLQLDFVTQVDPETGRTRVFPSSTKFYADHKLLYTIVEDTILMALVPFGTFTVVLISTIVTVLELNLRSRWRQLSSSSDGAAARQQVKLVKMLVVVSCIYIVTAAPNVALGLARSLVPEFRPSRRYANIFLTTHLSSDIITMSNSCANFFVYVTMSTRFRRHLDAMLCCQKMAEGASKDAEKASLGNSGTSGVRDRLAAMLCCRESSS